MFIAGFKSGVPTTYVKYFLERANRTNYINKSFVYVVKLDDKTIKVGATNYLYNRFKNYNDVYKSAKILGTRQFNMSQNEFNEIFKDKLIKFNKDILDKKGYGDAKYETTILKTKQDMINGKYNILNMD